MARVNHQALEFWYHVTHILLNLVQLLVSVSSFLVRVICTVRLQMEQFTRVMVARMLFLANLFTVRALSWTSNRTQTPCTTSRDPSR
jgi:hypothetical protein